MTSPTFQKVSDDDPVYFLGVDEETVWDDGETIWDPDEDEDFLIGMTSWDVENFSVAFSEKAGTQVGFNEQN